MGCTHPIQKLNLVARLDAQLQNSFRAGLAIRIFHRQLLDVLPQKDAAHVPVREAADSGTLVADRFIQCPPS